MKIYIPAIVLTVLLSATGCNSNQKEQSASENPASVTDLNTQNPVDSITNSTAPVSAGIPATPNATDVVALNPAHGAPGHRCDIEVGQPLNSPPKINAQPVQPAAPQFTPPQAPVINSQPANTKLALNPEHGMPRHRCDIAVGAALN